MMKINWNNLTRYKNIFLYLLTFVLVLGFLLLEMSWILKILMICLCVWGMVMFFKKKEKDILVVILYFLLFYNCYSLFFFLGMPLWLPMALIVILTATIYYFFCSDSIIYSALISLIILELFLSLLPWPTDPKGKAMILVGIYYLFNGVTAQEGYGKQIFQKSIPYVIICLLVILMVILSSQWYNY